MARYRGPSDKICRRVGAQLYLKGQRVRNGKSAFDKKGYPPGMHGRGRRAKVSEYGRQLLEKQKIRESYGLLERQFRRFFREAQRQKGVTGENLMGMLESRLDNVVYRLGFAATRRQARQLVVHSHFLVNNKKVNIPSYIVQPNDKVRVRDRSRKLDVIHSSMQLAAHGKLMPNLEVDRAKMEGVFTGPPARADIPFEANEQLVVELYSR
ncbi:30S ribosomal protein S4 [bacterium]|jgi:small subunit ribosomal protein S4|nr:30S ribosomal protein S4 [bacterium]